MKTSAEALAPWIVAAVGLLTSLHPTFLSGFQRMQGDTGDTRFNNYVLEHEYRAIVLNEAGRKLWDPPFFFPATNVLAHSDTLLSTLPLYAAWRVLGFHPDTSFQLWWLALSVLNYVLAFLLLRRAGGFSALASAGGAFLFAFGGPRMAQTGHQQLFAQCFSLICLYAIARHGTRRVWIPVFFLSYVAQFYASFYLWWFFTMALGLAAAIGWRRTLTAVRKDAVSIGVWAAVAALLLAAGGVHYVAARESIGYPSRYEVLAMVPRWYSWIYLGPENWLYGWQAQIGRFARLPMNHEHRLGLGLVTTALVLAGFYHRRSRPVFQLLFAIAATLVVSVSFWMTWASMLPSGGAVRAPGRVVLLLLIPAAAGLASMLDVLRDKRPALALVALAACIGEQAGSTSSYGKMEVRRHVADLAAAVPAGCQAFFYTPRRTLPLPPDRLSKANIKSQIDAMWAQLALGIPTVNGYSGYSPATWEMPGITLYSDADREDMGGRLASWLRWNDLEGGKVCRVETIPDEAWSFEP